MTVALAAALQLRYLETGDLAHLDAAIAHSRADLADCETGSATEAVHLSRLCNALRMHFEHLGRDGDLDEAIEAGRGALEMTPDGHRQRAQRLSNLGFALRLRYERLGRPADIEEAVELGEQAVAVADEDDPDFAQMLSNLAVARRVGYEVSADPADLARAVEAGTHCLRNTALDAYERRGMLNNLGLAYLETFEVAHDRADLVRAGSLLREALMATPDEDPDWPMYALNLSVLMRTVATELHAPAAADQAIELAEMARQRLPAEHRERAGTLSELGRAHWIRAVHHDDRAERRLAVSYRRAAARDRVASSTSRALAAIAWGDWSRADDDLPEAIAGMSVAIELLTLVAWHGLDASTQHRHLSRWQGLAASAAATCLQAHELARAVALLEQGRTVLWNQALDRRADVEALRSAQPAVAARLAEIRDALDADRRRETRVRLSAQL
ncbi:hypothetical protein ACGFJ7_35635 [Actinoplanes sp. NPDC048988]|uniref:hypothetical protein n=1 Tax=Actinoplanes sp. NPDC048988 TaxID=3363901 RepID=UPI0037188154